ncbi:MAG: hypothetical protein HKN21_09965 [Candidatus Eisenbacteria bacterium]|uniref:Organic solvent tolerance-like N-terminal domain-containing protein n=1 Tax=Eiseniibacteriota bacterium TaxID=2212470 RepID=A0A7Y2E9I6_UNCEI|nr:hypothetical protein [Candidatus Eisenbacteria bacterium]
MKYATLFVLLGTLLVAGAAPVAALPDGKIAVVRVTAVDGLAKAEGPVVESRSSVFSYDGSSYMIDRRAVGGLDGVETLLLIDHRVDTMTSGRVSRRHSQEVRAIGGTYFEVEDIPNKVLAYQVASVAGNLRITGDGDQILCEGGDGAPYRIWRIDGVDLVDRKSVVIK